MHLRKIVASLVFVASSASGVLGVRAWLEDRHGLAGLTGLLVFGSLASVGMLVAVGLARPGRALGEFRESGYLSPGARKPFLVTFLLAFAAMFAFIAARGVVQGHIGDFGERPEVVFASSPGRFVFLVAFWCGLGVFSAWAARWVVLQERTLAEEEGGA